MLVIAVAGVASSVIVSPDTLWTVPMRVVDESYILFPALIPSASPLPTSTVLAVLVENPFPLVGFVDNPVTFSVTAELPAQA